jgi:hypothetical protein
VPGLARAKFARAVSYPSDGVAFVFGGTSTELFGEAANFAPIELALGEEGETLVATPLDTSLVPGGEASTYRTHHALAVDGEGTVLVIGGLDGANSPSNQVLLFDPEERSFAAEPTVLNRARFGHQATRIEAGPLEGAVLVTGGLTLLEDGTAELVPTTEIYVPR